ncbi:MAG: sulfotransferase family 2 domain-containing protein [Planctomycetes bacterium]|jgi:hypothetical protein|nr:sulfotransferase family 2 domain-containing protein [Planctomycetota bacterium]MBT4560536.1 sulfotransferase family 2 domain-containing protein [Planctomycetota bacterium]MBT7318569.1 sulfotransferase family 2 domain-containing protein [Planctomycetota bacterium]
MLLSNKKKFIFVHIYKTAGTSAMQTLLPYARRRDRAAYGGGRLQKAVFLFNRFFGLGQNGHKHITGFHKFAPALDIRAKLGKRRYENFYSFGFARNPYDWVVSTYFHLKRIPLHPLHQMAMSLDFNEYILKGVERSPDRQCDFLCDSSGELLVSQVGHVETFEEDMRQICQHLSIPFEKAAKANVNPGRKRGYQDYYTPESRSLVHDYFAQDFELFGYDPDNDWV